MQLSLPGPVEVTATYPAGGEMEPVKLPGRRKGFSEWLDVANMYCVVLYCDSNFTSLLTTILSSMDVFLHSLGDQFLSENTATPFFFTFSGFHFVELLLSRYS